MNELLEHIRAAVAQGATPQQKAIGAQACRTILAALDAEPGKPIVLPGALPADAPRVSIDQVLELMIARLNAVAAQQGTQHGTQAAKAAPTAQRGLRIPAAPMPGSNRSKP